MRSVWVILIVLAFFSGTLVSGSFVFANFDQCEKNPPQGQNKGAPFLEIWAAICDLNKQFDELEQTPGPQGPPGEQGEQGPPGQISDQQCPAGEVVSGFQGGNIICVPLPDSPSPFCGDGTVNGGETCDDGNNLSGDGCSSACQVEGSFCTPGICDDGNSCTTDSCDEIADTCENTPIAGCGTNFSGTWDISPAVSYICGFGLIDFNFNTIQVVDNNPDISFITSGNPDTMAGTITGNNFVASKTIAGSCTETYSISGAFTGQNSFSATFSAQYTGQDCDVFGLDSCTDQSWQITGTSCSAEVCNGIDDDCDGIVDDGAFGSGQLCTTGLQGVCREGAYSCTAGALVCNQTTQSSGETCNGLDDDCNGTVDDGSVVNGQSCSTGLSGVCSAGTSSCTNGNPVCNQIFSPSGETCNGLDDDCDGMTDEDAACGTPTAFRFTDLDLRDPHIFVNFGILAGCQDVTDNGPFDFSANDELQLAIQFDGDGDERLDYSPLIIFRPLDQTNSNGNLDFAEGLCTAPLAGTTCDLALSPTPVLTLFTNVNSGSCLGVIPGTSGTSSNPSFYNPPISTTSSPPQCFVNDRFSFNLPMLGTLPLSNVQVAANYNADPATGLTSGLLRGFLPESVADNTVLPSSLPFFGGQPLSSVLPGGTGSCSAFFLDGRDDFDGDGTKDGWWFYFNYNAEQVPYVGP